MKTVNSFSKTTAILAIGLLGCVTSCKDKEEINGAQAFDATSESQSDSYFADADDVSVYSVDYKSNAAGGRVAADDYRVVCATFTASGTKTEGTLVIDFGTGCTDAKGNVRKGKINLAYSGTRNTVGFTITETFTDYYINGIKLEGTRVITRVETSVPNSIKHNITLTGGKATWPDNTFVTRSAEFNRVLSSDGVISLTGGASGKGRKGNEYTVAITDALIYKATCINDGIYIAVQGTKVLTIGSNVITISYGEGSCDRKVIMTFNGTPREIAIGNN